MAANLFSSSKPLSSVTSITESKTRKLSHNSNQSHQQWRQTTSTPKTLTIRASFQQISLTSITESKTRKSSLNSNQSHQQWRRTTSNPKTLTIRASFQQISLTSQLTEDLVNHLHQNPSSVLLMADSIGYSLASYYTSLGLFVISVPGLWSLIKRSVKSKIVQKTFVAEAEMKKSPNQVAGEILSFFTRNNFVVSDRGETITFEGVMVPSRGQAALLTFCTCISLASVGLVLTITFPDVGNNWFWITLLSPLAGAYYWKRAARKEEIKIKMITAEDGRLSEIIVQGDDQQVEQLRKELQLNEKGMVYVKGLFERL